MWGKQQQTKIKLARILGAIYSALSSTSADVLKQNHPATAPHSSNVNGLPKMWGKREHSTLARAGEGAISISALRASDSLSDTKIFVLLAAIVFVFLLALGVAMTRVSRSRRRQHNEEARHHIIAANAPPQTLNKTILDLLPVFEVTERRQLRKLHTLTPTPGAAFSECFAETHLGCSSTFARNNTDACESTVQWMTPRKIHAPMGGYGLDSGKSSLYSVSTGNHIHDVGGEPICGNSYKSDTSMLTSNHGAVELAETKKREQSPLPRATDGAPFAVEAPAPAAFRLHGRSATRSATPPTSGRRSAARGNWDSLTPGYDTCAVDINIGGIFYCERSSRSLDLGSEREFSASTTATQHPCAAWMAYQSQPEIVGGAPRRISTTSDSDPDAGSCPICLEEFEAGEHLRELPCMHRYHVVCIDTWLVSRSTCCPYCKLDIRRWYYGPDIDDTIPHSGPLSGIGSTAGHHEVVSPAEGVLVEPELEPRRGSNIFRRRPLRIERRRAGQTRLARMWRAVRGVLAE
ncbi:hypothetical protein H4S08_000802 [Coemansia sp. RSA 1365]|nr:hypothetical protein H4S08_000802 [Coemansia sp. RSA 1365]